MARAAKLGGTIALDGEKEYKKAIDEITAGLKVNYTQMGLVAAQYAVAGNSEEALRAKSVALSDTIASQTEKIELMRGQLAKSIEKNGEGSKTTMQYQAALNKAETELVKMNNQMDGYQQQLAQVNEGTQNASKSTKSLADVAMGMADTFGLSVPPAMQNTISKLDGVSASGAAAVGMIGAMVGGLAKLTLESSENAKQIKTNSQIMGMTTDKYQEWDYILGMVGASAEDMSGDLAGLAEKALDAAKGAGEGAELFEMLDIKVTKGGKQMKTQGELFDEVVTKLQRMGDETKRNAIASALLSSTGEKLVPVLDMTKQQMNALTTEAHKTGAVLNDETITQFIQLDDAMQRMSKQGDTLKNSFAIALLPIMTAVAEAVSKIPTPLLRIVIVLGGLVTVGVLIAKAMRDVAVANAILSASNVVLGTTSTVAGAGLSSMIPALLIIAAIAAIVCGSFALFNNQIDSVKKKADSLAKTQVPQIQMASGNYPRYATGTNFHPGGHAVVGENGPEIVDLPRGTKVYPNGKYPKDGGSGQNIFYVTIDASRVKEFNDIVEIAQSEATSIRQGVNKS